MVRNILRSVLIVMCSLVFMVGCASTMVNKLSSEERSSLKKLIFIPGIEDVSSHNPHLTVKENYRGKTVSLLGSGGEEMSMSTYKYRTAQALKVVQDCLSTTYEKKTYAPDRFKSLMSEMIAQNNPLHITFISEAEQEQFYDLSKEGKAAFIENHNADAALIMKAYHKAGLDTKIFGLGSFGVAYTGLCASIDDYQSDENIYFSGYTFTNKVPVANADFCKEFIDNFEHAVDEHTPRLYNEIIGVK